MTSSNFCAIILPVSERNMKNQMTMIEIRRHFNQRQRMGQMREWKATPESERPTWEQFKRGLQPHPGSPLANFQAKLEKLSEKIA